MYNTWGLDIVWVREMGLEVYALVILSSLVLLAVTVDAQIALIEVYLNLFLFLFNFLNFFHRTDLFLISYLIYSLSKKPDQEPNDESADSVIAGIVKKISRESEIRGVAITSRILTVFRKKISLLHSAFKKASKSGGKSIKKLIDSWKAKKLLLQNFLS